MKKKLLLLCCFWITTMMSVQSQSRFKTVNYLNSIRGNYILSGQHNDQKNFNGAATNASYWTNRVQQITGKYPALYSCDFGFESSIDRWAMIYESERQWNAGAVINIMWHACPPTSNNLCDWYRDIQGDLSASQWSELLTNGSNLNTIWKSRMDEISVFLQYLEDKGVEVVWRPLHEQNQTNFWWNSGTRANTRALWILTHDYMTTTKGLSNLIWNWNVQDLDTNYAPLNPGSNYFDIMSLDIYSGGHTDTSFYNAMMAQAGSKPVGLGETFKVPTTTEFANQPNMSFFMVWSYGLVQDENGNPTNTTAQIQTCYNNPRVITRDEMPGWNNVNVPTNLATAKAVTVSSTEAGANVASNAVDGSLTTRWSSLYTDAQWFTVDLGANYNVNRVKINWEAAYGKDYRVTVSSDGTNWTTLKTITGNTSLVNDHTGLSGTCRYVSINGTARGTVYGYSIYELEVYGTPATANQSPSVSMVTPINNSNYTAPASVSLSATATDTDGTIAKVDFYNGTTLLNSDTTAPYQFSWTNVASGTYAITARATDNNGAVTTSSAVNIAVNNVNVSTNLATAKPATVSSTEVGGFGASNAVDGSLTTRWSSLYTDAQWFTVDLGANYNVNRVKINWEAAYGKDYRVTVSSDGTNWTTLKTITGNTSLVNDHTGLSGTCRYVSINGTARGTVYGYSIYELEVYGTPATANQSPSVSMVTPINNSNYTAPASVSLSATATDTDGTIAKVDFYNGTTLLNSDTTAPYQFSWTNVASGTYAITARATDNNGAVTTSSAVNIAVNNLNVSTNLATAKPATVSSTEVGGFGASNAVDGSLTTRWSSLYTDAQWFTVDLGANYNVNRVKINWEAAYGKDYRVTVSSDGTNWTTLKTITGNTSLVNDHTGLSGTCRYVSINGTARGTVYGYSIYELEVYGTPATANQSPSVSMVTPINNSNYTAPASVSLSATATDTDGTIAKVDFYNGTTLLNSDTTAPYQFSWTNVASGTYAITARATDNNGAVTTSSAVNIAVNSITPVSSKKVVAYVANWIDLNSYSNTIDYSKLTHINIAFENPNANGDLSFNNGDATLIQRAHANNVKVFVSIGGGSASEDASLRGIYFNLISDAKRAAFVSKLAAYVQSHNFDGLDVDLEGPAINGDYGKFITDLSNALKPIGKGLTAALSQGYGGNNVPTSTFAYFDFINIMAYDATGPWNPSNAGPHSSFAFAQSNLQYWLGRGLAKNKAVLGLPFYGYGFGSASGEWSYSRIVATYAGAENNDQAGSTIYYNGIPTIKAKVNYAYDQDIAGVMIWELSSDATGAKSLLLAINQVVTARGNNANVASNNELEKLVFVTDTLSLFPNPTSDFITVNYKTSSMVSVFSTQGIPVITKTKVESNGLLDLSKLPAGIYYVFIETDKGLIKKSIVKK